MTLQEAKDTVNSSFPSVWSREDVFALLERIEKPTPSSLLTSTMLDELVEEIYSELEDVGGDLFYCDNAEFEVNVNYDLRLQIQVESGIELDESKTNNAVTRAVENWVIQNGLVLAPEITPEIADPSIC